jgi:hypothetical protein
MIKKAFPALLILSALLADVSSCEKINETDIVDMEGIYVGSFSKSNSQKSVNKDDLGEYDGRADVTMVVENLIRVYCHGDEIDTTFMLNYYEHHDNIMVCLTDEDFENEYGHMLREGHMSGGMMGDGGDEHEDGDEHFGSFNLAEGSFSYSFRMMDGAYHYLLNFYGVKE